VVVVFSVVPPSSEVWVVVVVFLSSLIAAPYPLAGKTIYADAATPSSHGWRIQVVRATP
jgi:hypothetical protein